MAKLICIVGQKRSGKDTIAKMIKSHESLAVSSALADPIKHILYDKLKHEFNKNITFDDIDGTTSFDRETIDLGLTHSDVFKIATSFLDSSTNNKFNKYFDKIVQDENPVWTVRRLLQFIGTDLFVLHIDKMHWVKFLMIEYFDYIDQDYFIVTDIRQEHEIKLFRDLGAKMLFVKRDNISTSQDSHITEQKLPFIPGDDYLIDNSGSLDQLEDQVINFLKDIKNVK